MTAGADTRIGPYLELFAGRGAGSEPLGTRRQQAIERFEEAGFPTPRDEEWRQTNLGPILRARPVPASGRVLGEGGALPFLYPGCDRMVFVNGRYAPAASSPPQGVTAFSLADPAGAGSELLAEHLGASVDGRASCSADAGVHPFAALNTALFEDGAAIGIPAGAALERPIQVLWLSAPSADAAAGDNGAPASIEVSFPRLLVVAGENSQASVIETFAAADPAAGGYFVCPAAEFVCAAGSVVRHTRLQADAVGAFHLGFQHARLDRAAAFDSSSLAFGGALVRNDTVALLDGEGADCSLDGLYVLAGSQFTGNHMRVEHRQPHTTSHQRYKGVLDGQARSVFNGRIYVHQAAQKTDAKQTNRNLLLSKAALANSNPQLEIFADDVRCTHGSTIGRLDDDALFYLRARGIGFEEAHGMLVHAFAREVTDKATFEPLRRDLEARLFASLNGVRSNGQGG
ncbi:MAG: Fe-S cluster assembly protein SufD [Acidobacteriota bacterium]|nr:Fe-S cluster assembly protein SufD [Acidobacteriota bacterium]